MNLPKRILNKADALLLVGVIPSKSIRLDKGLEPDLTVYVDNLVDELLDLCSVEMYSAYSKAPISVKVRLLLFMMDFQGYAKFFCMSGAASFMSCNVCLMESTRLRRRPQQDGQYSKMALLGHASYDNVQRRSYPEEVCKSFMLAVYVYTS